MASTSGGARGGRRDNSGRKRLFKTISERKREWERARKRISLENNIFQSWIQAKHLAGYDSCSDSEFAQHLLSLEYRRRESQGDSRLNHRVKHAVEVEGKTASGPETAGPQTSTPARPSNSVPCVTESPIVTEGYDDFQSNSDAAEPNVSNAERTLNSSMFSEDEGSDDSEQMSSENHVSYRELYNSAIQQLNDNSDDESDISDLTSSEDLEELSSDGEELGVEEIETSIEEVVSEVAMEGAPVLESDSEMAIHVEGDPVVTAPLQYGPHKKLSRGEEQYKFPTEMKLVKERKFICSLDLLLELFAGCCRFSGCSNVPQVKHHFIGATVIVNCLCQAGHTYRFCSSHEVNGMYANNLLSTAAVLLSGNNFAKIGRMADFMGLAFPSTATFFRVQRLYCFPVVEEWWSWMRSELVKEFVGTEVVVGGDGQCDSPGFSAKNICYFLMEITSNFILEIEVRDKRHVGLSSTNMEKEALTNALKRLSSVLKIVEVATDASASIKKLIANEFKDVFHSLDVWHKSKSIRKCLGKIGQTRGMGKIKAWSDHIIRHFWYCCSVCKLSATTSDEVALKVMKDKWIGLLHHVCNSHEWINGQCEHEAEIHDPNLSWFDRRDNDFAELQKIVLNKELLDSFKYYVRFRHTGSIECANSLSLVYTPKRTAFSYRAYRVRKYLTGIDWNFHLGLPTAKNKKGEQIFSRKYNQRTKQWDLKILKAEKGYEYIPIVMASILQARMQDIDIVTRNVSLNESDPRLLATTIAAKPPPPSNELIKRRSRFSMPSSSSEPEKSGGNNSSAMEH